MSTGRARFVGDYDLRSLTRIDAAGREESLGGGRPRGRTGYDAHGRMWVLIAPSDRRPIPQAPAGPDAFRQLLDGVVSYYGTYEVIEATSTVVHQIEAALDPAWVGLRFVRRYRFAGNLLILSMCHQGYTLHACYQRLAVECLREGTDDADLLRHVR